MTSCNNQKLFEKFEQFFPCSNISINLIITSEFQFKTPLFIFVGHHV